MPALPLAAAAAGAMAALCWTSGGGVGASSPVLSYVKVVGYGDEGQAAQGVGVKVSNDKNTLAFGGPEDNANVGAVWVFARTGPGGTWEQQGNKLVGNATVGPDELQGSALALSGDGNTLAFGAPGDDSEKGAVFVFTRSGSTWSQQGPKLRGSDEVGSTTSQGTGVALAADGNTLAFSGIYDDSATGCVWVFTRTLSVWTQQGAKLAGTDGAGVQQGNVLTISGDGNTLAWASEGSLEESVWVFERSGNTWVQRGPKIEAGNRVALNHDGTVLAIGQPSLNSNAGGVRVYTRQAAGVFSQQGTTLIGSGGVGSNRFQGNALSLNGDGNVLVFCASNDNGGDGAMWVFVRSGSTWTQVGSKFIPNNLTSANFAGQLDISSDATVVVASAVNDNSTRGGAYVLSMATPSPTLAPTSSAPSSSANTTNTNGTNSTTNSTTSEGGGRISASLVTVVVTVGSMIGLAGW